MQGLRAKLWSKTAADSLRVANDTLGTDVTRAYFRNIESLTAIAKKYGMVSQFFWQPCVYTKTPPTPVETSIINSSRPIASFYRRVHKAMKQAQHDASPANFHDISNVLDSYSGTAFIDTVHTTELANEMVARQIVTDLKDILDAATSGAPVARAISATPTIESRSVAQLKH